jgi:hypothetical protein
MSYLDTLRKNVTAPHSTPLAPPNVSRALTLLDELRAYARPAATCVAGLDKDGPGAPFAPRKPGPDRLAAEAAEVARIRQRDEALVRSLRWL